MKEHTGHGYMKVEVITMCLVQDDKDDSCLFLFLKKECRRKVNRSVLNLYINGNLMDSQSAAMYRTEREKKRISSTVEFKGWKTT